MYDLSEKIKVTKERIEKSRHSAKCIKHVFRDTPEGRSILEHLREEFCDGSLFAVENQHQTAFNLGQRDVIKYLETVIQRAENLDL